MGALIIALGLLVSQPIEAPLETQLEALGVYEVTAYAEDEITATGTVPRPYKTVAVDPSVIPLGTVLYIEGIGEVTAEDTGGAVKNKVIDIYLPGTEEDTASWGRQNREVWRVN